MTEEMKKKLAQNWSTIVCGVILVVFIILSFPIIRFDGNWIALFAPTRPVSIEHFDGWVLGNHVLETEHGEIRLGHRSQVFVVNHRLAGIDIENFQNGRSSHNLVVHGIEIPPSVDISFHSGRVSIIMMHGLRFGHQEVTISGERLYVSRFLLHHSRDLPDIAITVEGTPEYITLADYTVLDLSQLSGGGLSIFKNDERWRLRTNFGHVLIKLPREAAFTRYRSITFRPDWGEFIEGELFE